MLIRELLKIIEVSFLVWILMVLYVFFVKCIVDFIVHLIKTHKSTKLMQWFKRYFLLEK